MDLILLFAEDIASMIGDKEVPKDVIEQYIDAHKDEIVDEICKALQDKYNKEVEDVI